ncbi:hypothetical protein GCM10025771_20470 [Niveibacterium umoris]
MRRQAGFTLVEMAIVLVIIGLLLGGVLKGQELIESAKVKNIAQDMRAISVAVLTYQDKYRALPGDDKSASARWSGACAKGDGNGLIDNTDEIECAWDHLRRANLLTGDPSAGAPVHADAGTFTVTSTKASALVTDTPGTLIVCANNIRGRHVLPLDAMLDNGVINTGSMRSLKGSTPGASASAAVDEGDSYVVCMGF